MADEMLALEDFKPHVGTDFTVATSAGPLALNLVEAELTGTKNGDLPRQPFGLLFQSGIQDIIPQQLFPLHHDTMGDVQIFLVPTAQNPTGVQYYATFN